MSPDIVYTQDGSITCLDVNSGELYHNRIGAYTEALCHYVHVCDLENQAEVKTDFKVLDICFGLGYNTFVFLDSLIKNISQASNIKSPIKCQIIAIDKDAKILDLVPEVLIDKRFNHLCQFLTIDKAWSKKMVAQWQTAGQIQFEIHKPFDLSIQIDLKINDLRNIIPQLLKEQNLFDYIFHDGFSPRSMPQLWTVDLFSQYFDLLKDDGRIITYSSAYAVRGALKQCGLEVRKSVPLGGKSGGTVAFKKGQQEIVDNKTIFFLSIEEEKRLNTNSGTPYRDPTFNSTKEQIIERREAEIKQKK